MSERRSGPARQLRTFPPLGLALFALLALLAGVARADGGPQGYTNPNSAALAPNGSVFALEAATPKDNPGVVLAGSPGRIFLVNPDGTQLRQVVQLSGRMYDERVTWLPDSSGFFFVEHIVKGRATRLGRYIIASKQLSTVTIPGNVIAVALSGDGKTLFALVQDCAKSDGAIGTTTCVATVNAQTLKAKISDISEPFGAAPDLALLPDGHTVLIAESNELHWMGTRVDTYDQRTGKLRSFYEIRSSAYPNMTGIDLAPDNKLILYSLSGGPGYELRVTAFPSNKVVWTQPPKKTFGDFYDASGPSWSPSGDSVAFRWDPFDPTYADYIGVWSQATGVRYFELQEPSDGNLSWLDASHIAWLESDGMGVLDLTSGQVTTAPYDKTLTEAAP